MQVTLSGRTGRNVETNQVDRLDDTGSFPIAETSLAVNVAKESDPDWHKLKFVGDALTKAAAYIPKGAAISVVGTLTFEHWNDDDGILRSKSVVTVSEVQLPARTPVAAQFFLFMFDEKLTSADVGVDFAALYVIENHSPYLENSHAYFHC